LVKKNKQNTKQKLVEKYTEKSQFLSKEFFFRIGPDPAQPFLGWVGAASLLNSGSLHCSPATWTVARPEEEEEEREGEEGWLAVAHGADGGCGGGRTQLLVRWRCQRWRFSSFLTFFFSVFLLSVFLSFSSLGSILTVPILLLSSFSLFLFVFFCFFFLFSFSSSSVFFSFSNATLPTLSPFSCSLFPCIYRQIHGGKRSITPVQSWHRGRLARAAIIQPPQDCPRGTSPLCFFFHRLEGGHELEFRQVGVVGRRFFGSFGERGRGEKQGKVVASSSPASRVQGKKKTHSAVQNGTVSGFFF